MLPIPGFINFSFLHYNLQKYFILCYTCVTTTLQHRILQSKRPDPSFVSVIIKNCVRTSSITTSSSSA